MTGRPKLVLIRGGDEPTAGESASVAGAVAWICGIPATKCPFAAWTPEAMDWLRAWGTTRDAVEAIRKVVNS